MRNQERAPRTYELMTILHPEVPEESLQSELDRIAGYIDAAGGSIIEILQDSPWGRRRLAYPIRSGSRDVRDGYYTVWHMNLGPTRVDDLERELKLNTQVIRYIVVSWEPKPLDEKEIEAAEIAAEDAAAAAYAAAQAAVSTASEIAEADAGAVVDAEPDEAVVTALEPVAAEEAREAVLEAAEAAEEVTIELAAHGIRATELTAAAEAAEAAGAELAIEPVTDLEEREELVSDAAAALEQAEQLAVDTAEDLPEPPAGAIRAEASGECPDDFPIKGNASSMLYHSPGSPSYKRTIPEFCFASVEAAEAAGFGPTKYEAAQDDAE